MNILGKINEQLEEISEAEKIDIKFIEEAIAHLNTAKKILLLGGTKLAKQAKERK